jgi:biopolymer transport protein TolR
MLLRRAHHESGHAGINVTPLIDVVMCLIIFYLLVGQLATQRYAPMKLPTAGAGLSQIEPEVVTIELEASGGKVRLNGELMSADGLVGELRARREKTPGLAVQLRADRGATYEVLRPVLEACREAGLSTLRLAASKGEGR